MTKKITTLLFSICALAGLTGQPSFTNQSSLLENATIHSRHPVAVTDINGDFLDDIVRLEQGTFLTINYQASPNDLFIEMDFGTVIESDDDGAWGMTVADIDGNGINDILAGGRYDGLKFAVGNNDGTAFTNYVAPGDEIFTQGINFVDINNDGYIDVFACHDDEMSKVLINDGNGGFIHDTQILPTPTDEVSDNSGNYGSVWVDVNNDNRIDLYIAKCRQFVNDPTDPRRINQLFIQQEDGTWVNEAPTRGVDFGAQSWCADFGDVDNDGDYDLFVGNHDVYAFLYLNDGTGNFTDVSENSGVSEAITFNIIQGSFQDLNNDGWIDIFASGAGESVCIMNNGDGTFSDYQNTIDYPFNSYGLGDLNNDGHIDIYAISGGYGSWGQNLPADEMYFNDGNENHYLRVSLIGNISNINGIGANIAIEGPWGTQIRTVKAGESYGIVNSLTQHFGLGTSLLANTLTITWPSGIIDVMENVTADQHLILVEGFSTGIEDIQNEAELLIYPTPSNSSFTIKISDLTAETYFNIYDISGKLITSNLIKDPVSNISYPENTKAGVYTYQLKENQKVIAMGKLIKID